MPDMDIPEALQRVQAVWGDDATVVAESWYTACGTIYDATARRPLPQIGTQQARALSYPSESSALKAVVAAVEAEP